MVLHTDRFTAGGPVIRGRNQTERFHPLAQSIASSGTTDTVARAAASTAQTNVDALIGQPNEIIGVDGSVFGPWGQLTNTTGAPVTLDGTNPQTEASLLAAGLTSPPAATTETGTNWTVPVSAVTDATQPTIAEIQTWYDANVGPGLAFNFEQHPSDLLAMGDYVWQRGDGDGGSDSLVLVGRPSGGGHETVHMAGVGALSPSNKPDTLRRFYLEAETPLSTVDGEQRVIYTLPSITDTDKEIEVIRTSTAEVQISGDISGNPDGLHVNETHRVVILKSAGAAGWIFSR